MVGMTHAGTAITSDLDEAHLIDAGDAELASANSAAERIGADCLADGPVGRVGLEIEAHCFDLADPLRRPEWNELTEIIAGRARPSRRKPDHRRTRRRSGTVRAADGRRSFPRSLPWSADRAVLRSAFAEAGFASGAARRRPAAAGEASEPR